MTPTKLREMGFPQGPEIGLAVRAWPALREQWGDAEAKRRLDEVLQRPEAALEDPLLGELARALVGRRRRTFIPRETPAPYRVWGSEQIDPAALAQMEAAVRLPVSVGGALMPDAHVGYGLPIGGVLATKDAVIPYAVGVDIACRMRLSVFPIPGDELGRLHDLLRKILLKETVFGAGATQAKLVDHPVLHEDWTVTPVVRRQYEKAREQLGTSGSGNHFVEWGVLSLERPELGLDAGNYLALLSHSGSRGAGAAVADFYSRLAMQKHPELPEELRRLAWLELSSPEGQEYWAAMELMGRYASANHAVIHERVARALGERPALTVENHHNFAWKETWNGQDVVVHRKGATPAGVGVLGIIPGSMASPGFVVRGRGVEASINSASHGAGRAMSRTAAKQSLRWGTLKGLLAERGVTLLSAGIDEAPPAYKDIHSVMSAQSDLIEVVARFDPRIVRMADSSERPED
ncbi:MAG: RtcB family protein [Tepidisphaerales bacterium]